MRTSLRTVLLALLTTAALLAPAQDAFAADTVHHGRYWAWTGPSTWIGTYGTYGIRVNSPSNQDVLDLGFSNIVCTPGATYAQSVSNYFAALRRKYDTAPFHLVSASAITHPAGSNTYYRRQGLRVTFRSGGVNHTGNFAFDYDYATTVSTGFSTVNYCYQRSLALYAPTSRYDTSIHAVLVRIYSSLAYSGPGACLRVDGTCDPDI